MYRMGTSQCRSQLCRMAVSLYRSFCVNSEQAISNGTLCAERLGPNLDSCTNSSSKLNPNVASLSPKSDSRYNPNIKPSTESSDRGATQDEDFDPIWAVERLSKGKRYTGHERKQGRVPGYIVDKGTPTLEHVLIVLDKYQIQSLWSHLGEDRFLHTVFTVQVFDGLGSRNILYKLPVLPRRINHDKYGRINNVGFVKALPGVRIHLDTPVRICGQESCIGLKKGGHLKVHLNYASLLCSPEELPPYVMIDITQMDIGDKVFLGDLKFEVPLHSSNESSLVVCEVE